MITVKVIMITIFSVAAASPDVLLNAPCGICWLAVVRLESRHFSTRELRNFYKWIITVYILYIVPYVSVF